MLTVMVIDDEPDILKVVSYILKAYGYQPVTIDNGQNILDKVSAIHPAMILLDIQLGHEDGRYLCKQIKETREFAHIPVILFSANNHYRNGIEQYLCDDFIEKPFDIAYLVDRIKYFLKHTLKLLISICYLSDLVFAA